jgi:hypothetical protein
MAAFMGRPSERYCTYNQYLAGNPPGSHGRIFINNSQNRTPGTAPPLLTGAPSKPILCILPHKDCGVAMTMRTFPALALLLTLPALAQVSASPARIQARIDNVYSESTSTLAA